MNYNFLKKITSPLLVLFIVWGTSFCVYYLGSGLGPSYEYFNYLVDQEMLLDQSSYSSYLWLLVAFLVFSIGFCFPVKAVWKDSSVFFDIEKAIKYLSMFFLFTLLVSGLWIGGAILQFGGVGNLISMASSNNQVAREVVLSASFPGGRLISSGFIAVSVFASVLLSINRVRHYRNYLIGMLIASFVYLAFIPILVSGRINFFVAVFGASIAYVYAGRKGINGLILMFGIFMLCLVWIAKEYFNLGHVVENVNGFSRGVEGLVFYFYNDFLNYLNVTRGVGEYYTLGWYSLRFVFFFTFSDAKFKELISNDYYAVKQIVTAGEIPLMGAPLVDFGVFGLLVLFSIGLAVKIIYKNSTINYGGSAIYGIVFAGLVLSSHGAYLTSAEVVYSIVCVYFMSKFAHSKNRGGA